MPSKKLSDRVVQVLEKWVGANSHHSNVKGVYQLLDWIIEETAHLNLEVLDRRPFVRICLPGTTQGKRSVVTLVSHADTVFPEDGKFQTLSWNEDHSEAIGPGVIDDKGGILVALLAIERLAEIKDRTFDVHFLCMPNEEIGSPGLHELLQKQSEMSHLILGFEPSLKDGSIIHSRRGNRWYEIELIGPGGHAGRDAGKVMNPLVELSSKLAELSKLTIPDGDVSVTPTVFQTTNTSFNVIPSKVTARLDVRYTTNDLRDSVHEKIMKIMGASAKVTLVEDCPAFPLNPENLKMGERAIKLIREIEGVDANLRTGHGSSDCNYLWRKGIPILDGLGAIGEGLHTEHETLLLSSLFTRSQVVSDLIKSL